MKIIGTIYLSGLLVNRLVIPSKPVIAIRAGNIVVTTRLVITSEEKPDYFMSPDLIKVLYLSEIRKLQLRYIREADVLQMGPIIGILSTFLPNRMEYKPDSIQAELIYLSTLGKTLPALVYIFTISDINWKKKTVKGYIYQQVEGKQGAWVSSVYPLPDVVYDRVVSRSSEARAIVKQVKQRLMSQPYLQYFNPSFLNKWRVHKLLSTNPEILPYLPETHPLNAATLAQMLKKYMIVYMKPSNGSLGRGIIKVSKDGQRLKYVCYQKNTTHGVAFDNHELLNKTRSLRQGKPYIIQQGIELQTYRGSPFDIRIICQKNGWGEWQVGKKFVRIAALGSSISNLSSGGQAARLKEVFKQIYHNHTELIEKQIHCINLLCHMVAAGLEQASGRIYGELGLDLGIDKNGVFWLIEVNSKPRKSTATNFSKLIVHKSFKRPLQYAIYLAGFQNSY